jgi:hypothetical protein
MAETREQQREVERWRTGLDALHTRVAGRFRRREVRELVRRYLAGIFDRVGRNNGWQLAEHLGEAGSHGVQRLHLCRNALEAADALTTRLVFSSQEGL